MTSYVRKTLSEGEQVIACAKFHWIRFFWPVLLLIIAIWVLTHVNIYDEYLFWEYFGSFCFIAYSIYEILELLADNVTLTNQRLVAKRGLFSRKTLDLRLSQVESVSADLPFILSTLFNTGTLLIRGTGGSYLPVPGIWNVLKFRKTIQDSLDDKEIMKHADISVEKTSMLSPSENVSAKDRMELLTKLKGLLDAGVLSQEEFQTEKERIMRFDNNM